MCLELRRVWRLKFRIWCCSRVPSLKGYETVTLSLYVVCATIIDGLSLNDGMYTAGGNSSQTRISRMWFQSGYDDKS